MVTPNDSSESNHSSGKNDDAWMDDTGIPVMEPEDIIRNLMRALEKTGKALDRERARAQELLDRADAAERLVVEATDVVSELKQRLLSRMIADLDVRGGDKGVLLDADRFMQASVPIVVRVTMADEFGV
jgi:ABC-type Fe3+-hydroxamate transport system substrate-binding protein